MTYHLAAEVYQVSGKKTIPVNNQFFHTGSQRYYTDNKRQLCAQCTYIIILYGQLI